MLAVSPQLRRAPYLTDVVGSFATINWATDHSATVGAVKWGRVGSESCTAHTTAATKTSFSLSGVQEYQWKASLTLTPGAEYCYRIYLGNAPQLDLLGANPSPHFWAQVPDRSSQAFSFVVFGDWGQVDSGGANPDQANVIQQIANSGARFAITIGDNGYPSGTQLNYGDLVLRGANTSAVFGPSFWPVAGARLPLFPAIGNHGLSGSVVNHPHLVNWPQDQAVASSNGRYTLDTYCCLNSTASEAYPSAWYAFDAGNARFYVLDAAWDESNSGTASDYQNDYDSHWQANSAEYQWLANDLATHPSALKFAFFHYPIYSDTSTEPSDVFLQGAGSLEGLLSSHGVNIAFSGHAHIYQRNRRPADGMITYVTGGGGAAPEPIGGGGCSALDAYGIGWSTTANSGSNCGTAQIPSESAQVFHFLLVHVSGTTVAVTPTDELGRAFDRQTYDFGSGADRQPPSPPANFSATVVSATRVDLAWARSTDTVGVSGYVVKRNNIALATLSPSTLSYIDRAATAGTLYTYSVEAFDAANNQSASSNAETVMTSSSPMTVLQTLIPLVRR